VLYGAIIFGIYIGGTALYGKIQGGDSGEGLEIFGTIKKLFSKDSPTLHGYEGMGQDHSIPSGMMDDDNYGDDEEG
jgi:hypothetical protein